MSNKPSHERWTMVFEGTIVEAKIVQSELEGEGIPAIVPDASQAGASYINMVGIRSIDGRVFVPPDRADEARRMLERRMPPLGEDEAN